MSNLEHYFENLLFDGRDVPDNCNKNSLSEEQQSAVEECANYIVYGLFGDRNIFLKWLYDWSEPEEEPHTCNTCGKICQMMGTDRPACLSYEPMTD